MVKTKNPGPVYVYHNRLITQYATNRAKEVVTQILRGEYDPANKEDLFFTLHVCAFRYHKAKQEDQEVWLKGWHVVRNYITEQNIGLVYNAIGRFNSGTLTDEDDILSEALYAFHRAIERFDPFRGFKFSTYAMNVIFRSLGKRGRGASKYYSTFSCSFDSNMEQPTTKDLPDDTASVSDDIDLLRSILENNEAGLSEIEKTVLSKRFGERKETFNQIAEVFDLSKERIRQLQEQALEKLRDIMVEPET